MQFKQLFDDDRAVSPVIGVILMVAITVILAAVIGSFVLGLGNSVQQTAPNANFDFDYEDVTDGYDVTATHTGGDTIPDGETLKLEGTVGGSSDDVEFGYPVDAGSEETLEDVDADTTVRVVWTSENGESSQTLADAEVPS